jgi:hypothetical protein
MYSYVETDSFPQIGFKSRKWINIHKIYFVQLFIGKIYFRLYSIRAQVHAQTKRYPPTDTTERTTTKKHAGTTLIPLFSSLVPISPTQKKWLAGHQPIVSYFVALLTQIELTSTTLTEIISGKSPSFTSPTPIPTAKARRKQPFSVCAVSSGSSATNWSVKDCAGQSKVRISFTFFVSLESSSDLPLSCAT